ncbi:hypothetical protein JQK87_22745 [Streptomyces sp. G44]|uniref:hypothetical protein n=1 Tax=Streptomyces sp. G44 TaxID=2807632 RepID=UPI00195F6086|nr:hypothetical protein [Streptomyces sp. G44]MBM7171168.1 hypothetical protein [Streptomyces sp. G44]
MGPPQQKAYAEVGCAARHRGRATRAKQGRRPAATSPTREAAGGLPRRLKHEMGLPIVPDTSGCLGARATGGLLRDAGLRPTSGLARRRAGPGKDLAPRGTPAPGPVRIAADRGIFAAHGPRAVRRWPRAAADVPWRHEHRPRPRTA